MIFDSHCHVQFNAYKGETDEIIKRTLAEDVWMLIVGSQKSTSERAVNFANIYQEGVWAAIGLHPVHLTEQEIDEEEMSFISRQEIFNFDEYLKLGQNKKVVAVGEVGLEYFHQPKNIDQKDLYNIQAKNFIEHCRLADELNLPIIIHCRDAHADQIKLVQEIIERGGLKNRGVVHCFTGNWQEAKAYLDLGFYLGFTGVINFPPKKTNPQPSLDLLEVVKNTPLNKILAETDSPYLAPPPYRGKRNEPIFVKFVVEKIAEIKGISFKEAAEATFQNTRKLFKI